MNPSPSPCSSVTVPVDQYLGARVQEGLGLRPGADAAPDHQGDRQDRAHGADHLLRDGGRRTGPRLQIDEPHAEVLRR